MIFAAVAVAFASCASNPRPNVTDASGKVEVIEHKGTAWGAAQPERSEEHTSELQSR